MRLTVFVLVVALAFFMFAGCDEKEKIDTGIYQVSYLEDSMEYVELIVDGKTQKYVVKDNDTEYAAVPDFLQKGDETGFEYRYEKEIGENIIVRFFTPDE
jgi:hypothetical protein